MKFERDQFSGNHGIVFNVSRFTLSAGERGSLRTLQFGEAKAAHYEVSNLVVELYDKMLELYPDRANPGSLWSSAAAAKAET